ncbi:hypothetical protein GYA19_02930, partial [Candidatus Beckwithbacteria bacterium]|nr:hypothetical protein [Candidatus Beckwithbacteria bacterium]
MTEETKKTKKIDLYDLNLTSEEMEELWEKHRDLFENLLREDAEEYYYCTPYGDEVNGNVVGLDGDIKDCAKEFLNGYTDNLIYHTSWYKDFGYKEELQKLCKDYFYDIIVEHANDMVKQLAERFKGKTMEELFFVENWNNIKG